MLWIIGTESETSRRSRNAENSRKGVIIQSIAKAESWQNKQGSSQVIREQTAGVKGQDKCRQKERAAVDISFSGSTARWR